MIKKIKDDIVLTIAHTKGGVGKSTISWSLGVYLLTLNKKVTLVDLDFQQTLFGLNNIRVDNGLDGMMVIQPSNADELIDAIDNIDGIIIIDVGGFDNDITRMAIDYSDIVVVPISDSMTEVLGLETFKAILKEIDTKADIKALLNNVHHSKENFDDIIEAIKPIDVLNTKIRRRNTHKEAMNGGKSAIEIDTKVLEEIKALYTELNIA